MTEILKTDGLTKEFDGIVATDRLDYTIQRGEVECVIGPNGAGKTTFFNLITGAIPPDDGTVSFDGEDITGQSLHEVARKGMVRKYQTPSVYENISVRRNVAIATGENHENGRGEKIAEILELVGLSNQQEQTAGSLDHGNKQWLEIGMVLANDPKLILLDEPTAGMTKGETAETAELVHEINRKEGVTIIAIEHDMDFVRNLSTKITVLHKGSVLAEGTIEDIENNVDVQDVYLGGGWS